MAAPYSGSWICDGRSLSSTKLHHSLPKQVQLSDTIRPPSYQVDSRFPTGRLQVTHLPTIPGLGRADGCRAAGRLRRSGKKGTRQKLAGHGSTKTVYARPMMNDLLLTTVQKKHKESQAIHGNCKSYRMLHRLSIQMRKSSTIPVRMVWEYRSYRMKWITRKRKFVQFSGRPPNFIGHSG